MRRFAGFNEALKQALKPVDELGRPHVRENYERACTMRYRPACEARDHLSE